MYLVDLNDIKIESVIISTMHGIYAINTVEKIIIKKTVEKAHESTPRKEKAN